MAKKKATVEPCAKPRDDNTSDITTMNDDKLLVKVYQKVSDTERSLTESIHRVDKKVDVIDTKLKDMATIPEVEVMLAKQKEACRDEFERPRGSKSVSLQKRQNAKIIGATSGIAAALWAIAEVLRNLLQ
jgi:hypothetical protein